MLHYILNKSISFQMILPFTFLLGALGYLYYKSKDEVTLVDKNTIDSQNEQFDDDDLYRDLKDLFI